MVKIRDIQQPTAQLYKRVGDEINESRDFFVGTITDYAQFLDVRAQIKEANESGYYFRFRDHIIRCDRAGNLDDYPSGFFGEIETDLLLELI